MGKYSYHNETMIWLQQIKDLTIEALGKSFDKNSFINKCQELVTIENERVNNNNKLLEEINNNISNLDKKSSSYRNDYLKLRNELKNIEPRKYPEELIISDREGFLKIYYKK